MKRTIPIILGAIQLFTAVGGLPAGLAMVMDPSGQAIGFSTEILTDTPFNDFLIPGIFLLVINGLFNLAAAINSFLWKKYCGQIGLALGVLLTAWICIQIYLIGLVHFLQPLFLILGLIEIILSFLLVRKTQSLTK